MIPEFVAAHIEKFWFLKSNKNQILKNFDNLGTIKSTHFRLSKFREMK